MTTSERRLNSKRRSIRPLAVYFGRLRPNEYRVLLNESEIARYELLPEHFLAMNPGLVEEEIEGVPTTEPAFGLQALWVS